MKKYLKIPWKSLLFLIAFAIIAISIVNLNTALNLHNANTVYARDKFLNKPDVKVPVNLKTETNSQKSVDGGHSPWRLDPVFVAQVFISMRISPRGITGDYPIKYRALKLIKRTKTDTVVEALKNISKIKRVYLRRLVRQDTSGIWTVVGYDL